ncbi:type I-G CRISPR-associated protein Cas8g2 [Bradyrhizobium oligotrophicum]|uniref:type I-G CRISPR-associated protein Cas8g2 n=1 Tax=Bradyrhizobium oligotrophicum TaxID=44255 RepID=UPI003EBB9DCB
MAEQAIPVDLHNPGQVFACMGLLEAADILLGNAAGGFDWSDPARIVFRLRADGEVSPVEAVLEFLAEVEPKRRVPRDYVDETSESNDASAEDAADGEADVTADDASDTFPAAKGDRMSLPIRLGGGNRPVVDLSHWADGSDRNSFKLYAGNRSAESIARAMLLGVREKPKKKQTIGDIRTKGIRELWEERKDDLIARPFDVVTPMGGSFNFDPRGAWTAIDAGYSLNDQGHQVEASPVVEFLAAWGLEHARPDEYDTRKVRYAAWGVPLTPMLARAALCASLGTIPHRIFVFSLDMSGKNKVVTFAEREMSV